MSTNHEQFVKANEEYVATIDASRKDLPLPPARKVSGQRDSLTSLRIAD